MAPPNSHGTVSAAEVDALLPKKFFVRRGDVAAAFGLSEKQMAALVPAIFTPFYLPPNKAGNRSRRAMFVRSKVLAVARELEGKKL